MGVRLNKYIADAGICSRRKADELIGNGNVKVNGATMKELGYQVEDGDVVMVNGKKIETAGKKVYVVVNKPLGYITSMDDDKDRATVAELVSDIPERLFPVGRLDYNTSGLLIMTNDGQLTYTLTHPKHEVYKTYIAKVAGAGTLVPITGFANSVVSAAIDSKNEGFVLGLGSGIFTVAGPVLLYGTAAGTIYGVIYWICSLF